MKQARKRLTRAQQDMLQSLSEEIKRANGRADTLAKLSEVGQALVSLDTSPGELERLLQRVAENAQKVLGADVVSIYQHIQDRDEFLVPPVEVGELREPAVPKDKVFDDDVVVKIVRRGNPLYAPDVQGEPQLSGLHEVERPERPQERFVVREDIASSAAVPLRAGTEIVGLMFVNYRSPQPFTEDQREVIELFANQAAVAIRNARLFELISRQDELQHAYAALKEEQEKRIAAEKFKALGQAAATLAHKMNNLVGIIPVCVQEIRERIGDDDDVKENLDIIEHQARLLLYTANDLLKPFAPSEEGAFDVNVLVKDALEVTHPLLQDRIQVELRCCEELPKVKTTKLLGDVFVELITNAAKAMPDEGKLEIETRLVDGRMIEVSFTDTGKGIPEKKQKWIFESFGAFEPELEGEEGQKRPGIRFGLWWVKTFLQQQGGDVELRWSEVGKGSRFVVSYPVVS
jgi:signal transduction histidine kinase